MPSCLRSPRRSLKISIRSTTMKMTRTTMDCWPIFTPSPIPVRTPSPTLALRRRPTAPIRLLVCTCSINQQSRLVPRLSTRCPRRVVCRRPTRRPVATPSAAPASLPSFYRPSARLSTRSLCSSTSIMRRCDRRDRRCSRPADLSKIFDTVRSCCAPATRASCSRSRRASSRGHDDHCIGDCLLSLIGELDVYLQFVNIYDLAAGLINELLVRNARFAAFCTAAQAHERSKRLDLRAYMIVPIQRIPRYVMLLADLVEHVARARRRVGAARSRAPHARVRRRDEPAQARARRRRGESRSSRRASRRSSSASPTRAACSCSRARYSAAPASMRRRRSA
jgi:hypothetical protein